MSQEVSMSEKLINEKFVGLYPVSKTLRFELKPIGRTKEYIEMDGIIDTDTTLSENYTLVKGIIDRYHKSFIEESLRDVKLKGLQEFYELYNKSNRDTADQKRFERIQDDLRKQISQTFKKSGSYATLFKKELIKNELPLFVKGNAEEERLIASFSDFTTYFTGFNQNRANMYSNEAKSTAIAYRLIHQNLPKFMDNMKVFKMLMETEIKKQISGLSNKLSQRYQAMPAINTYFELDGFNNVLTQQGIDVYNTIIGGFTTKEGLKTQGLNEYINLYMQKSKVKMPKFKPLFKQILSDRNSLSFIPENFANDEEVLASIETAFEGIRTDVLETEEVSIGALFDNLVSYDLDRIFVDNDASLTTISQKMYGDWSVFRTAINERYDNTYTGKKKKPEKYEEEKNKILKNIKSYSINDLDSLASDMKMTPGVANYFSEGVKNHIENIYAGNEEFQKIKQKGFVDGNYLKKSDKDIARIKKFLDSIKELQWFIKPLTGSRNINDKDEVFYVELLRLYDALDVITPLYNKVRNYVTSKPYSTEKIKLNFGKSTLLGGWDKNKERDNLGVIFLKDNDYFLGIMNRNNTKILEHAPVATSNMVYKKMNYKFIPGPNKMLPKVFFSKSREVEFAPSEEVLRIRKQETFKKGDNFNIEDCHTLIDFFKDSIKKHEEWSQFGFMFTETEKYKDISGFYREVENQGYKITFNNIDESYINRLVDEGALYLFQIYNKDFSPYSKGTPNLHTLYWRALFSPDNLKDVIYKLNGEAEIFYRKASIRQNDLIIHPANEPINNKDPQNNKKTSLFKYDIVKDRRYACDKFQFHVPITMNFKAPGENQMNTKVNMAIRDSDEMHIIGIDRGERNLLYLSVIDLDGKIVEQFTLNELLTFDKNNHEHIRDYHELLDKREKENIAARQNWTTINTIKELKEGYLSQVIHVICRLIIKYNAIVVLEDLNFGFKRGRQKFEKAVYQKFEKMLIDKLNYLVDKNLQLEENGSLLKAYQLTGKFESFQKMGKQTGILYYVPAWNTSKIDPTTGFVNLFYTKYESIEKTRLFITKFENIWYDQETSSYAFKFNYSDFTYKADGTRTKWILYSHGKRVDHFRNKEKNNEWDVKYVDLTEEFTDLFERYNVNVNSAEFQNNLIAVDNSDFYKRFMKLFALMVQMRNSDEVKGLDQTISPVKNRKRTFYISGTSEELPLDADANGAYNIAKKGLLLVRKIKKSDKEDIKKIKLAISNKEWLSFAQENLL